MGDIVNLRRARKVRTRSDADRTAEANRIAFGRTKAEKSQTQAERKLNEQRLEGHRLERARDKGE
jgi:hypothetical protein